MISLLSLLIVNLSQAQKCRTISLEAGGTHGAYEAGVIWALVNLSNPEDVTWNVVSGVSVGSINTGAVVQYPIGQELAMSNFLVNTWLNITGDSEIYVEWKGGKIDGILFQKGLYDNSPLESFLRGILINENYRNYSLGSANLDLGGYGTFNESIGNAKIDGIISSSSIPFFFPTHNFEGYTWADGGGIIGVDALSSIGRCLQVTTEANIIADIIYDNYDAKLSNETKFKTPDVLLRTYSILYYDLSARYTYKAMIAYPEVDFRYVIRPSKPVIGGENWLNFSKVVLEYEIDLGINDTKAIFNSGKSGRTIIAELYEENKSKIAYPNH